MKANGSVDRQADFRPVLVGKLSLPPAVVSQLTRNVPAPATPPAPAESKAKWEPNRHPRDKHGRFIRIGDLLDIGGGEHARVTAITDTGTVRVRRDNGSHVTVDAGTVAHVESPGGPQSSGDVAGGVERVEVAAEDLRVGDVITVFDARERPHVGTVDSVQPGLFPGEGPLVYMVEDGKPGLFSHGFDTGERVTADRVKADPKPPLPGSYENVPASALHVGDYFLVDGQPALVQEVAEGGNHGYVYVLYQLPDGSSEDAEISTDMLVQRGIPDSLPPVIDPLPSTPAPLPSTPAPAPLPHGVREITAGEVKPGDYVLLPPTPGAEKMDLGTVTAARSYDGLSYLTVVDSGGRTQVRSFATAGMVRVLDQPAAPVPPPIQRPDVTPVPSPVQQPDVTPAVDPVLEANRRARIQAVQHAFDAAQEMADTAVEETAIRHSSSVSNVATYLEAIRKLRFRTDRLGEPVVLTFGTNTESARVLTPRLNDIFRQAYMARVDLATNRVEDSHPLPGESEPDMIRRVLSMDNAPALTDYSAAATAMGLAAERLSGESSQPSRPPFVGYTEADRKIAEANVRRALADERRAFATRLRDAVQRGVDGGATPGRALKDAGINFAAPPSVAKGVLDDLARVADQPPESLGSRAARVRNMIGTSNLSVVYDAEQAIGRRRKIDLAAMFSALGSAQDEGTTTGSYTTTQSVVDRIINDAEKHLRSGGDDVAAAPLFPTGPEPSDYKARVDYWAQMLPSDRTGIGLLESTHPTFAPITLKELNTGTPLRITEETTYLPSIDLSDGGAGAVALAHVEALRNAGAALRDEIQVRVAQDVPGRTGDAEAELLNLKADLASVRREISLLDYRAPGFNKGRWEMGVRRDAIKADLESLQRKLADARSQHSLAVLREVRQMGAQADAQMAFSATERGESVRALRWAEQFYPSGWLAKMGKTTLSVKKVGRGYYNGTTTTIALSDRAQKGVTDAPNLMAAVAVHEIGHHAERTVPGLFNAEAVFHYTRTSTGVVGERVREKIRSVNGTRKEKGRTDKYTEGYTGREYPNGSAYEVFTTGVESLFGGAAYLDGDPDMTQFILGALALL